MVAIINPRGRRTPDEVGAALERARPASVALRLIVQDAPAVAIALARRAAAEADLVVAIGGDGTVAEVASGLLGTDTPLGIVPTGSTNIVAQERGIPADLDEAAQALFGPLALAYRDAGVTGERCFLHMAGAGLDARFFAETNSDLKRRVGWVAYLPAAAAALRLPPSLVVVDADERRFEAVSPLVLIANGGAIIHPVVRLHPDIQPDDGWFDVFVFTATDPVAMAQTIASLAALRLESSAHLEIMRARRISIAAEPALPVQFDGDVVGSTPTTIDLVPCAIGIAAPRSNEVDVRIRQAPR
ncbi:MAG: NAD(+)/NADH kinase [Thermomicrobiales bacterium]|nr:NAD(+)/NADH kinase [Thermomicrobiales bacterium]